jgi:hypothetical protein
MDDGIGPFEALAVERATQRVPRNVSVTEPSRVPNQAPNDMTVSRQRIDER